MLNRFPQYLTTTEQPGRAMIEVARYGAPERILESLEINRISDRATRASVASFIA
ncbi:MAG: hypothetical protein ABI682_15330 [Acidobacteriota bacterium]